MAPVSDDALWRNANTIGNDPELKFVINVTAIWDETKVLIAEIGRVAVIVRHKGDGVNSLF